MLPASETMAPRLRVVPGLGERVQSLEVSPEDTRQVGAPAIAVWTKVDPLALLNWMQLALTGLMNWTVPGSGGNGDVVGEGEGGGFPD